MGTGEVGGGLDGGVCWVVFQRGINGKNGRLIVGIVGIERGQIPSAKSSIMRRFVFLKKKQRL